MVSRSGPLHRRDTLLSMFWPEHSADRGRNALSKVIYHLRQTLGPASVVIQGDQIGIAREHVWCDVTAFEEALESGRTEEALALYRGELLEGFHISGSSEFDHWSDIERSRLRRSAVASAWELVSIAEQDGDGVRATKFARQAVEWAPRDEAGLRRLLTLLQRRGQRAEALAVFDAFSRRLEQEYEIDPSGPTLELVAAIRDGSLPYDLAGTPTVAPNPEAPTREPRSPDLSTARDVSKAHTDSRPRWGFVTAVFAIGLTGAFALYRSDLAPIRVGRAVSETPRVLVTEFDDQTEEELATVVTGALRVDLSQSRALDLVERAELAATLGLMGLESSVTISPDVGREIAVRAGLEVLVEGAVASAGTGYIITAAIRSGGGSRTIASFRESADGPDQVIAAIDRLSLGIREALGEAVDTIRAGPPLERVTTPSLEALTLYTRAIRAFNQFDDRTEAARLLQRAVALDPGFAMAWRMLGVTLQNEPDQSLRMEAVRQAYHHRDRLSELERFMVEASYYSNVERDGIRGRQALLGVLSIDPENPRALNNLGINYLYMGKPDSAEGVFRRALGATRASSGLYRNLVGTRISLGWIEEAAVALDEFERVYPDHALLPGLRANVQFLSGAVDEARAGLQRVVDDPYQPAARRADALAFLGRIAYWEGNYVEARSAWAEGERVDAQADPATVLTRLVESVHTAALVGDVEWARTRIETKLGGGLPAGVLLDRAVLADLTEALVLVFPSGPRSDFADDLPKADRLSGVYARISSGDTVGVRTLVWELPLTLQWRVLLFDYLEDTQTAIELYEQVRRPGYTGWGNTPAALRASMRLGSLYEEIGDTARAIDAYRGFSGRWAKGDTNGRAVAERFSNRALALETKRAASLH